jgi:hypothetical protein
MEMTDEPITLREYVDVRFEAEEKAVQAALASADRAVAKAEAASERRFDSVNEFRGTLADQARLLMPRSEAEQSLKALADKIDILTQRINQRDDRGRGMDAIWGYLIGAVGIGALIVSFFKR